MLRPILGTLLAALTAAAFAQPYPAKTIHLLVAFPAGGPVDIIARLIAPKMGELLGKQIVVENKVGASGNVATAEVAKSAPDGYTLLTHSSAYAVNPTLFSNPGYDPVKDLLPIAVVAQQANIVVVNASFPARTLEELKRAMQKGKPAFASPGAGTTPQLTAENLFPLRWKTDATHVPFKGAGPAVAGLLSGEPPIGCMAGSGPMANIKAGKPPAPAPSSAESLPPPPPRPPPRGVRAWGVGGLTPGGPFSAASPPRDTAPKLEN